MSNTGAFRVGMAGGGRNSRLSSGMAGGGVGLLNKGIFGGIGGGGGGDEIERSKNRLGWCGIADEMGRGGRDGSGGGDGDGDE